MKRIKEWWSNLKKWERNYVVYYEKMQNQCFRSSYYPDDCYMCSMCGAPTLSNICTECDKEYEKIIDKANKRI